MTMRVHHPGGPSALPGALDTEKRLDAHLAQALDELLSLASLATASGRPELALGANAAVDHLLAFLVTDDDPAGHERARDPSGDRPHVQH